MPANCDSCSWAGSNDDVTFVGPDEIMNDIASGAVSPEDVDPVYLEEGMSQCPECGSVAINFDYD